MQLAPPRKIERNNIVESVIIVTRPCVLPGSKSVPTVNSCTCVIEQAFKIL